MLFQLISIATFVIGCFMRAIMLSKLHRVSAAALALSRGKPVQHKTTEKVKGFVRMLFVFCSGLVRKLFANHRIKPGQFPNEGRRKGEGKAKDKPGSFPHRQIKNGGLSGLLK